MIRFSCPGCGATYSVTDEKGGKTGRCPKCQTQFLIPMPEGGPAPPPPGPSEPPPGPGDTVEIAPCPGCGARLSVAASDLGLDVECPYCKAVYKAAKPGTKTSAPAPPKRSELEDAGRVRPRRDADEDEENERPSRRRRDDEDDEDRPSRRRRDEDDEDDRPSRRRRRDDEDEEEERPRRRRRRRRRSSSTVAAEGAAQTGLTLGIVGIVGALCCPLLGFILGGMAIKNGNQAKSDSDGELGTPAIILGWIAIGLAALNCIAGIALRMNQR